VGRHFPRAVRQAVDLRQSTQAPGSGNTGHTAALYWAQVVNYAQYFGWQFAHDWSDRVQRVIAVVFAFVGGFGAMRHWRADRRTALAMSVLMFTFTLASSSI